MLCSDCNKKPAVMNVQIAENNKVTQLHLCAECAAKKGLAFLAPFTLGDVFPHTIRSEHDEMRCPTCGMTLSEFKRVGAVGCQHCYQNLRAGTEPVLRQVQKGMQHVGRTPVGHAAAKLPPRTTTPADETFSILQRLQLDLNSAVAKEDFETAAQLRDRIRAMEAEARNSAQGGDHHDAQ